MNIIGTTYQNEKIALGSPLSFKMSSSYNAPADLLTLKFLFSERISELHSIKVYNESSLIFSGFVDEQTYIKNESGCFLSLVCRSSAAILLDNEAFPTTYYQMSNDDFFNILIKPFNSFKGFLTDRPCLLSVFNIPKGMSVWEALELYCLLALNSRPMVTKDGYIDARKIKSSRTVSISNKYSDMVHYSSLEIKTRRCEVISDVLIRSKNGNYSTLAVNPAHNQVYRRRFLIPNGEWSYYPTENAKKIISDSMMKKEIIEITIPGIIEISLYDKVNLYDSAGSCTDVFVGDYSLFIDDEGYKTKITLYYEKFT